MRGKFGRVIATIIFGIVYAVATALYSPKATLLAGPAAGRQFANDADAFVSSSYRMSFLSGVNGLMTLILVMIIVATWWSRCEIGYRRWSCWPSS